MTKKHLIAVRNEAQKIMLEHEYFGQFSDGYWENSQIDYKPWIDCAVLVSGEEGPHGKTFHAKRCYNLEAPELLDIMGGRMLGTIRLLLRYGEYRGDTMSSFVRCEDGLQVSFEVYGNPAEEYWKPKHKEVERSGGEAAVREIVCSEKVYTTEQFKKDVKDLNKIIRQQIKLVQA